MDSCRDDVFNIKIPAHRIAISTISSLTAITAVLLNSLVLYSIWKTASLHKPSYILIANLALADFISGAVVLPLTLSYNTEALLNQKDVFSSLCLGAMIIGYWMGGVCLNTITIISVDRLLAIKLKNKYRTVVTLKRVASVLVIYWIGAGLVVTLTLLFSKLSVEDLIIMAAIYQTMMLTILSGCYSMAFHSLKKLSSSVSSNSTPNEAAISEQPSFNVSKYRRSFNTMLLVVFCVLLFYLPYVCASVVKGMVLKSEQGFRRKNATSVLMYKLMTASQNILLINSTANPLLYLWRMKDLRQAAVTTLRRIFTRHLSDNQEQQLQA